MNLEQLINKKDLKSIQKFFSDNKNLDKLEKAFEIAFKETFEDNSIIDYLLSITQKISFNILQFACFSQNLKAIETILNREKEISKHNTILHILFDKKNSINLEILELLYKHGCEIEVENCLTPLHLACKNQYTIEIISFLVNSGSNINAKDDNTPLHFVCENKPIQTNVLEFLLSKGADPNIKNRVSPIFLACQKNDYNSIKMLVDNGAHSYFISLRNVFHFCDSKNIEWKTIELLINSGANPHFADGRVFIESFPNLKERVKSLYSIVEDMKKLFTSQVLTDLEIPTLNGNIKAHKLILSKRIGESLMEKAMEVFEQESKTEVWNFLIFIYSGSYENFMEIKKMAQKIGMKNLNSMFSKASVLKFLKQLYGDDESKDFEISTDEGSIRVHKLIMAARSDLYNGMFLNVEDDSNRVKDYSGRSHKAIFQVIKFIYCDNLDDDLSQDIISELKDVVEYYQFNSNSYFSFILEDLEEKQKK
ncbi:cyclin-dependent kinase inhibitor 2c-related [Anaeramoeba ignava]|uniref:Cyclin-dependent kinase inhibitor 2c-related n=1 Tax=Anaeramoeba ignava TaxID=1746090 RepID=A0A9Q0LF32_ANAIG|nr:cyclin-dependent kinase inhibitor 2c-related [Anaeramoeba ignava]